MIPEVIETKQTTRLGPGNVPVAVLLVTWKAGTYGPFTEQSTWEALSNGTLMDTLRKKAMALDALPKATQTV